MLSLKNPSVVISLSGLILLSLFSSVLNAKPYQTVPLEIFYQGEKFSNLQLSPDGTHIIALVNVKEETAIITMNVKTGEIFYPAKTDNKEFKFNWIAWANNDRIIMSLRYDSRWNNSITYTQTRLLATDAKKSSKMIALMKPGREQLGWRSQFQDSVISFLPDDPQHILLGVDREMRGYQSVYKVNVYNGKLKRVQKYRTSTSTWIADQAGNIKAGSKYNDKDQTVTLRVLDPRSLEWVDAWQYKVLEEPEISILGFGKDASEIYLNADHQGRQAIYIADLSKPGYPMKLILSDLNYDVSGRLIYSPVHKDVVGLYYSDSGGKSIFWNEEFKAFQAGLDKSLPHTLNYIISLSADARKYVVLTSSPTNPGSFLVGDRDEKMLTHFVDSYPDLNDQVLVEKQLRHYKTRDGLTLEGYLSLPKNSNGKSLATIILPHGGPMTRDGKGFDSFSAFMVNRGYAVFQPNFRGSSGYGHDFMMMAVGGMGLEMQDDLEDAVSYLVKEKITDPQRVCIVGASYGGYAALMGATKTPDLFRCAISFAGISDIVTLRKKARYYSNKSVILKQLGDDKEQLRQTSPRRLAQHIKIPILMIHGNDDTVVPVEQSRLMVEALNKYQKRYEYVELEGGSHYLDYMPHRQQTFEAMENFLSKYLPVNPAATEKNNHAGIEDTRVGG